MANSPLISNGALSLSANGDLQGAPDIQSQVAVTLGGYNCIYDSNLNSGLIPYLNSISDSKLNRVALTNIVSQAYAYLIAQQIITNLQISIPQSILSTVYLNINATDAEGNSIYLNWIN